ncbi:ATP-dependent helicase [Canibacter zhoujuaniae]|uniref:ATP-dependent helicase n=1 Tax=Canibacter zhoujuaniae TaxID=2708343 RepID=UPI00141E63EF|nr:ATP-dependent helicase [Canibacter zhoujuaniae]
MTLNPEDILRSLDESQRAVAKQLIGPVVVRAGAGSGKTRAITHRIAYGVQTGVYAAEHVLAITYTRKAMLEMKHRLRSLGITGVTVNTIHAEAMQQLAAGWHKTTNSSLPELILNNQPLLQEVAVEQGLAVNETSLERLAEEVDYRKVSLLTIEEYAAHATATDRLRGDLDVADVLRVMQAYEDRKLEQRLMDWNDVLSLTAGMLLHDPQLLGEVHKKYRFFTVDEFQDISPLQYELLNIWLGDRENICVVGDASQTIYSFSGANQRFLLDFGREHPLAQEFLLQQNYRSAAEIVTSANTLIADRPGALTLSAVRGRSGYPVRGAVFETRSEEVQAVLTAISADLKSGIKPSEIAILARTSFDLTEFAAALRANGIACETKTDIPFFSAQEIMKFTALLQQYSSHAHADSPAHTERLLAEIMHAVSGSTKTPESIRLTAVLGEFERLAGESRVSLNAFRKHLNELENAGLSPAMEQVRLLTIHAAKGLEWSRVYLVNATDSSLPNRRAHSKQAVAEERRLAYVAITRARDVLRISLAQEGQEKPSRFLREAKIPVSYF